MAAAKKIRLDAIRSFPAQVNDSNLFKILSTLMKKPSLLQDLGSSSTNTLQRSVDTINTELLNKLGSNVMLPASEGTPFEWTICRPETVFQHFWGIQPGLRALTLAALQTHSLPWNLIVYHDELTPGNIVKPDNKRKMVIWYFTYKQLGQHIRNESLWWPIAVMRHTTAASVKGSLSGALRHMFLIFFSDDSHISGVVLDIAGRPVLFTWVYSNLLGDEDALRATYSCKGSSGIKPCVKCKNIIKKGYLQVPHPYLRDISQSSHNEFDMNTDDDVYQIIDHLSAQKLVLGRGAMEFLEKSTGFNFNEGGLLFDMSLRQHVKPATQTTFDPMHCYLSNGIMSTEIHELLLRLKSKVNLTFAEVDSYCQANWKTHSNNLSRQVFSTSRAAISKDGFKGSASELLSVIPLLRQLLATVVDLNGAARAELLSFFALCDCIDMLITLKRMTPPCPALVTAFEAKQTEHLQLHRAAYNDDFIIPKHHYCMHIPAQIRRDDIVLDAFVVERKHRAAKQMASEIDNTSRFEKTMLARLLRLQAEHGPQTDTLRGTTAVSEEIAAMLGLPRVTVGEKATVGGRDVAVDDILFFGQRAVLILACVSSGDEITAIANIYQYHADYGTAHLWKPIGEMAQVQLRHGFGTPEYWSFEPDGTLMTLQFGRRN